jgi:NAD(P)-dependent dehydrogenase (short-subunit alcohol dehydrogenase family)
LQGCRRSARIAIPADLGTDAGCRELAAEVGKREESLHILVNNAGSNWGAPLAEYPDAAFDKVFALNVKSVFNLTRLMVPLLERAASDDDPARVINIGSIDGLQAPTLETYAYSSSKAAVHHLTRTLAHRLAPSRITVNAIAPGPFESKMMAATLERFGSDPCVVSVGTHRQAEDMAGTAIFVVRAGAY